MTPHKELLEQARARGAVIIDDSQPGSGFEDEVNSDVACIGGHAGSPEFQPRYDEQAVLDMQKRAEDARIPAEIEEATRQVREGNINLVRKYRFLRQEEYVEAAWDRGRVLWMGDFLGMLQTIRPDAFLAEYSYLGLRGVGFIENDKPVYSGVALQNGNSPEWSLLRVDIHGLPTKEKYRGWRTVLMTLIQKRIITEDRCYAVFGKPQGPRARPWWRTMYAIRNGVCGECRKGMCDCQDRYDYLRGDNYQYAVPDEIKNGKHQQALPRPDGSVWMPN